MDVEDTIVAIASAPGGGQRGIVRLTGHRVIELVESRLEGARVDVRALRRATSISGNWQLDAPSPALPCRLYLWPTRHSYTRQPAAEIHTLGCPPLLEMVLQQLCGDGARLAQPGEFTLRAFLAGRLDLPQAEAVLGVIDAHDQRQLQVALSQLAGGLSHELHQLQEQLLNLCADIEAGLDFAEEDLEFVSPSHVQQVLRTVETELIRLVQRIGQRSRTDTLPRIVLRGRPNVGKSTLWNALLRRDVALVSERPGTTRDYLEATLNVDGQDCCLIDSAGIDPSLGSGVDRAAQQLSHRLSQQADIVVLCLDATRPLDHWEWNELLQEPGPELTVLNKVDCGQQRFLEGLPVDVHTTVSPRTVCLQLADAVADTADDVRRERRLLRLSSLTGEGLAELQTQISRCLQRRSAEDGSIVTSTATRCYWSLTQALDAVRRARDLASTRQGDELVSAEIRGALDELGQVLGTVYTEDILDRIFSRFCIGK
jgi:tRNA modification GTPase